MAKRATGYADTFAYQWARFRTTQFDSHTGLRLSFQRFWDATRWKPKDLYGRAVVEVGSGPGRFTEIMLEANASVTTFDLTDAVYVNRENNAHKGTIAFFRGDAMAMPLRESVFDFAVCLGVLQHVPDPAAALHEMVRVVRPGGRLCIDWYIKEPGLSPFYQPKYFWRRWTVGMDPVRLMHMLERFIPLWLPIDTIVRRVPYLGPRLLALLRIPCWNYVGSGLNADQRRQWAILDTFDALASEIDEPMSEQELRDLMATLAVTEVEVRRGGNGLIATARKSEAGS